MSYPAFALLGICICAVGAMVGRKFVSLRVWMALSAAMGLSSMVLWSHGHSTQYVSNLWILSNVVILLPFMSILCADSCKPCVYAFTAVCAWLWFVHVINNGLDVYAPMVRVAVSLALVVSAALATLAGHHRVLLITIAVAALCDSVLYSFSLDWFKFNPPHAAWAVRNLVWCGVYISMAYTVRRR